MTFDGRNATTLVMFVLFAGASLLAFGLPAKAAFMPLLVGIPGALLCLAQLAIDLRRDKAGPQGGGTEPEVAEESGKSEAEMFVWLGLFTAALAGFGFLAGGPLIVLLFVRFSSRESWRNAIFAGAGTFAVLYGMFTWVLELSLFRGFVLEKLLP